MHVHKKMPRTLPVSRRQANVTTQMKRKRQKVFFATRPLFNPASAEMYVMLEMGT
jgi:hypothetical protein